VQRGDGSSGGLPHCVGQGHDPHGPAVDRDENGGTTATGEPVPSGTQRAELHGLAAINLWLPTRTRRPLTSAQRP
jgi:hypothetical protein